MNIAFSHNKILMKKRTVFTNLNIVEVKIKGHYIFLAFLGKKYLHILEEIVLLWKPL